MIIEITKLKLHTSADSLKKVPFDVLYVVNEKHQGEIGKFLKGAFLIRPDQQLMDDVNDTPITYLEKHGLVRRDEKKTAHQAPKPTVRDLRAITKEDILAVPVLTRNVQGKPHPYYLVNRRVMQHLTTKHQNVANYTGMIVPARNESVLSKVELRVDGHAQTPPCVTCPNGLLKSIKWNACMLGTRTCIDTLLMSKKEMFAEKAKQGVVPADYQSEKGEDDAEVPQVD